MGLSSSKQGAKLLSEATKLEIDAAIKSEKVFIVSKTFCPYCRSAIANIKKYSSPKIIQIESNPEMTAIQNYMSQITGARSVPRVFINGNFIGGGDEIAKLERSGKLSEMLR